MSEVHVFALFVRDMSTAITASSREKQTLVDVHLVHRIQNVLRLTPGAPFILFDRAIHVDCIFESSSKKSVSFTVQSITQNRALQPSITCILPMLKKESLELALYSLTELGASKIVLAQTQKSHNRFDMAKDNERMARIMQAAAEQSKNFAIPELVAPSSLPQIISSIAEFRGTKVFFDCEGDSFARLISSEDGLRDPIIVSFGPEGDLTREEKILLKNHGFLFCKLTPTILRAHQAVALGIGIVRTLTQ